MGTSNRPQTGASALVQRLREYGVATIFGYPGGPLTPLYDALFGEKGIRHILARDEQAAGFMADGFARATGRPGVCLAVAGPGVFNAVTPLATAFSDSVPMLLISGQVPSRDPRSGYYHENDQLRVCAPVTKAQFHVDEVEQIVPELDRAWRAMIEGRPGPVFFEVPGEVLRTIQTGAPPPLPAPPAPLRPKATDIEALAKLVAGWNRPLILTGGGVITADASSLLVDLAERLGAPVFNSLMGKCAIPSDHPLCYGMPWKEGTSDASDMSSRISPLFAQADGLLAIGCRFTQVTTGTWALKPPASLAMIDVDASEFGRHYPCVLGVHADAREAIGELLQVLPAPKRPAWAGPAAPPTWGIAGMNLNSALRRALPRETIVVADVTRLAYVMLVGFPVDAPRTFLHPAGMVSMGYGLPAAIGAKSALPHRPVVAIMGDGCFQMTGMELATAVQEKLPIVVVVVNDGSLTLIKALQHRKYENRFIAVDLYNPDFAGFARAFGVRHFGANSEETLERALAEALACLEPTLVEMKIG